MKSKTIIIRTLKEIKTNSQELLINFKADKIEEDELIARLQDLLSTRQNLFDGIQAANFNQVEGQKKQLDKISNKIIDIDSEFLEILKEIKQKIAKELNQTTENESKRKKIKSNFLDIKK